MPPGSGAVVMGTGIVSIGLSLDGRETLSRVLLAVAALVWLALGGVLLTLIARSRAHLLAIARTPPALTWVAGTNVLGARITLFGWDREAAALLALAVALWLLLVPAVLGRWQRRTVGASFVLVVATESVAVLSAKLAIQEHVRWLAVAAVVALCLGLLFYLLVLVGFDLRELAVGRGDHWISGGALAIATLACARCAQATAAVDGLHGAEGSLRTAALALWAAAVAWLPALLVAELVSRRGDYDVRRWSTVFPLGMYAVCSFADGSVQDIGGIDGFARVWIWVAFAAWLLVLGGMSRRVLEVARGALPGRAVAA